MIANCGHDEKNGYTGGKPGDQTGTEWQVRTWYSRPWLCVLRHPVARVRNRIASMARAGALNPCNGYAQDTRMGYYEALKKAKWKPSKIAVKNNGDCSSTTDATVIGAGYRENVAALKKIDPSLTTHGMRAALKAAGFEVLTDRKYLTSDAYLLPGDILLNDEHHVAINLTKGSKAGSKTAEKADTGTDTDTGTYQVTASSLNVREGDTTRFPVITAMKKGEKFAVSLVSENGWGYIAKLDGWACLKYTRRI